MADFCKDCSIYMWGQDYGELAGITTAEDVAKGLYALVICEGCGPIQVLPDGTCMGDCFTEAHGPQMTDEQARERCYALARQNNSGPLDQPVVK